MQGRPGIRDACYQKASSEVLVCLDRLSLEDGRTVAGTARSEAAAVIKGSRN